MVDHAPKQNISIFANQVLVLFGASKSMCEDTIVPIDAFVIHLDGLENIDASKFDPATRKKTEMSSPSLKRQNDFF
jgi:hypothetical protein